MAEGSKTLNEEQQKQYDELKKTSPEEAEKYRVGIVGSPSVETPKVEAEPTKELETPFVSEAGGSKSDKHFKDSLLLDMTDDDIRSALADAGINEFLGPETKANELTQDTIDDVDMRFKRNIELKAGFRKEAEEAHLKPLTPKEFAAVFTKILLRVASRATCTKAKYEGPQYIGKFKVRKDAVNGDKYVNISDNEIRSWCSEVPIMSHFDNPERKYFRTKSGLWDKVFNMFGQEIVNKNLAGAHAVRDAYLGIMPDFYDAKMANEKQREAIREKQEVAFSRIGAEESDSREFNMAYDKIAGRRRN